MRVSIMPNYANSPPPDSTLMNIKRSKYWNDLVNILDGQFPKGECLERGRAICMVSYIEMLLSGMEFDENGEPSSFRHLIDK